MCTRKLFISHITEETDLAQLLQNHLAQDFPGKLDIFVSSDYKTIEAGEKWLDEITMALEETQVQIILCSNESIKRPWVNFEAGAGWIRKIKIIPVCHSGMTPSKLPPPLSSLNVVEVNKEESLRSLYNAIAKILGVKAAITDFKAIGEEIKETEKKIKLAHVPNRYYHIVNFKNGGCLDVEAFRKSNGVGIFQWFYHGGENQLWQLKQVDENYFAIISKNSGRSIEAKENSLKENTEIQQQDFNRDADNQLWEFTKLRDETYKITAKNSGKCLSVNEDSNSINFFVNPPTLVPVKLTSWGDRPSQRWWLKTSETPI